MEVFMFARDQLSIGDWIIFWILMIIPLANIIVFFIIIFSSYTNQTLKNMLLAEIVLVLLGILLVFLVFGGFAGLLDLINRF
jgi:hypothetical protein